jgi:hypothetical protein
MAGKNLELKVSHYHRICAAGQNFVGYDAKGSAVVGLDGRRGLGVS